MAIVDPPYGINMDGGKIGGDNCGKAKNYTKKDWDKTPPTKQYFDELFRVSKNQIVFGERTTLLALCLTIVAVGLFGIKTILETLPTVNLLGLHLILQ